MPRVAAKENRGEGQHRMRRKHNSHFQGCTDPAQNLVFIIRVEGGQRRDLSLVLEQEKRDMISSTYTVRRSLRLLAGGQLERDQPVCEKKRPTVFSGFPTMYMQNQRRTLGKTQSNSSDTHKKAGRAGAGRKRARRQMGETGSIRSPSPAPVGCR